MSAEHDMTEINSTSVVRMRKWERSRISHEAVYIPVAQKIREYSRGLNDFLKPAIYV